VIEMVRRFLRQKFDNPIMAVLLGILALMASLPPALSEGPARFLALIVLAAGVVSKDASSGALQMILARPISRTDYLYGRYFGILSAYALFLAAAAALAVLFSVVVFPLLKVHAEPLSAAALARASGVAMLEAVLPAAVLLLFSTFLPGYGDVLGYFLLATLLGTTASLATAAGKPALARVARFAQDNVLPEPAWDSVLRSANPLSSVTGRWALAVVTFLVAAALIFRRREFAYGHD
jgi:ABC-type transport system involved in multi-copper enzyme maturation permease subunit